MCDSKSQGCRKLKRGSIVIIRRPYLLRVMLYSVPDVLLYGRMAFDDVCLILKLYVEINVIEMWGSSAQMDRDPHTHA